MREQKKQKPYGFITKPVGSQDLFRTVEMALYKHEADLRVRESEDKFRSVFHNTLVGVARVDREGRVLDANGAYCRFLGYSVAELVGMHFTQFTHPEDVSEDRDLFASMIHGQMPGVHHRQEIRSKGWKDRLGASERIGD